MKNIKVLLSFVLTLSILCSFLSLFGMMASATVSTIESFTENISYAQYDILRTGKISVEKRTVDNGTSCWYKNYYKFTKDGNIVYVNPEAFIKNVSNNFTSTEKQITNYFNSYSTFKKVGYVYKARTGIKNKYYTLLNNGLNYHSGFNVSTYSTYLTYIKYIGGIVQSGAAQLDTHKCGVVYFNFVNKAITNYNVYEDRFPETGTELLKALNRSASAPGISIVPTSLLKITQPGDSCVKMTCADVIGKGVVVKKSSYVTDYIDIAFTTAGLVKNVFTGNVIGLLNSFYNLGKTIASAGKIDSENYTSTESIMLSDQKKDCFGAKLTSPIYLSNVDDFIQFRILLSDNVSKRGTKTLFDIKLGIDCYSGKLSVATDGVKQSNNGTVLPQFSSPNYYVSYYGQSSSLSQSVTSSAVYRDPELINYNYDYVIPGPAPALDGYKFLGYSTKENSDVVEYQIGDTITIKSEIVLYPVFKLSQPSMELEKYVFSLDASNNSKNTESVSVNCKGTFSSDYKFIVKSDNNSVATAAITNDKYKSSNKYDLKSCNLNVKGLSGGSTNIYISLVDSNNKEIIKQTVRVDVDDSYIINYYSDGVKINTQTKRYNKYLDMIDVVPEKSGYTFMGWSTQNGSNAADYYSGDLYKDNKSVNFYAVWKENYRIEYSVNGSVLTISGLGDMASYSQGKAPWSDLSTSITEIIIGDKVTSIGSNAFYGFENLKKVTLSNDVTRIGNKAFWGCKNLTTINLTENIVVIGNRAFDGCTNLKNTDLFQTDYYGVSTASYSENNLSIGAYAFENCISLTSLKIPNNVTSVGAGAWSGCSGLEEITLSAGITEIEDNTFYGCSKLESIEIGSNVYSIGDGAFSGCSSLVQLTISEGVEDIGNQAFSGCSALESVEIPESTETLGAGVFSACSALEEIVLPKDLDYIGDAMFSGCVSLSSIDIPEGVSYIGDGAFRSCSALTDINLPEKVSIISDDTFYNCSSLTKVNIPSNITYVGDYAFASCENLKNVKINEGVTEIGVCAFAFCSLLNSLSLPSSIKLIDDGAFMACASLETVDMMEADVVIGEDVFSGCSILKNIQIPASVISIGENAFSDCGLLTISCFSTSSVYSSIIDNYSSVYTLVPVSGLTLSNDVIEIPVGSKMLLSAEVYPTNATDKSVVWRSDNESIVKVNNDGLVEAVSGGTANIIATTNDGLIRAYCEITVNSPVNSFSLSCDEMNVYVGDAFEMTYDFDPVAPTCKDVIWSSSNENIATIDDLGIVSVISEGSVTITGKSVDGGYIDSCNLICKEYVELKSLLLSPSTDTILVGQSCSLYTDYTPSNASEKYISLVVKNGYEDIVKVESNNRIVGLKPGVAYVYAIQEECVSNVIKITVNSNKETQKTPIIFISNSSKFNNKVVDYKSTITFHAEVKNDVGNEVVWYVNEKKVGTGSSYTVSKATSDYTIYCTTKDADGKGIKSEKETIKVNTGFFNKIVAFFKGLFGKLPVYDQ